MNSERKRFNMGGPRQSLMGPPSTTLKTPTRPRFGSAAHMMTTPANIRESARFSMGGGGTSTRRQSHFNKPTHTAIKIDTSDKRLQQEMIQKIHEYLVEVDGEEAVTIQQIAKPTSKDFVAIVETIYEAVAPQYELKDKKLVEEIPRLFNALGYPFSIKASTLQTVGASHSWHYLLHALCWLIDFVKMATQLKPVVGTSVLLGDDTGNGHVRAFRYSWLSTKFKQYRSNKGAAPTEENRKIQEAELHAWFENQEDVGGQLRAATATVEALQKENQEMVKDKGREGKIREDITRVEDDIRKASQYANKIEQAERASANEKESAAFETEEVRMEVEGLREQVGEKKKQISEQEKGEHGIKGAQARAIMTEHDRNRVLLREIHTEMDGLSKDHWMNQPKVNEAFATIYSQYRRVIGYVRNIRCEFLGEENEAEAKVDTIRELHSRIRDDARRLLEQTYADLETEKRSIDKEIQKILQNKKSFEITASVEEERLEEIRRRGQRQSIIDERETEDRKKERKLLQGQIDAMEREKEVLENQQHDVAVLQQDLVVAQRKNDETTKVLDNRVAHFVDDLLGGIVQPADHLTLMEKERDSVCRLMDDLTKENIDLATLFKDL